MRYSSNDGFGCALIVWAFGVILALAFWAAVIYVAWHFVSRYW